MRTILILSCGCGELESRVGGVDLFEFAVQVCDRHLQVGFSGAQPQLPSQVFDCLVFAAKVYFMMFGAPLQNQRNAVQHFVQLVQREFSGRVVPHTLRWSSSRFEHIHDFPYR